jgi:predicted NAD/FAD-dependent oxidoreductase
MTSGTEPLPRYVGVPGMSAMAAQMAKDLTLHREKRIVRLLQESTGWELQDESNRAYGPFEFVVVTLPPPQAAELLAPHRFAVEAKAITMTPCWAVLAAFDTTLTAPWDGAFVHDSPLSWVARNSSKPGRPTTLDCWVLHASPEWSAEHLEDSPDAVGPRLLDAFREVSGVALPSIAHLTAHRWRYSLGADPAGPRTLFDPSSGLVVCGDWLSGGRVEGAFLSGAAGANAILSQLGSYPLG